MRNDSALPRFLLSAALAVSGIAPLRATPSISSLHPAGLARVTIRGNGSAISVERSGASAGDAEAEEPGSPVLAEAVRLTESGVGDEAIVRYLRANRADIPAFVDFGSMSALRDAGAGRSVVAYLSIVSAVEMGPTGAVGGVHEGPEPEYGHSPEEYMTNELPADLAWGGWGGGGLVASGGRGPHVGHHGGARRGFDRQRGTGFGGPAMPRPAPHPAATPAPVVSRRLPWR